MNNSFQNQISISQWTKFTFYGWLLGVVFILMLSSGLDAIGIEGMQFYLGVGMGAGVGFAQWFLLHKLLKTSMKWIWFSTIGLGGPFVVLDLILKTNAHKLAWGIILGSLVVGILQYFLLKKYVEKPFLWLIGCFLGWTLGVATVFLVDYTKYLKTLLSSNLLLALLNLFLILSGGVVLGLISGFCLKKIFDK